MSGPRVWQDPQVCKAFSRRGVVALAQKWAPHRPPGRYEAGPGVVAQQASAEHEGRRFRLRLVDAAAGDQPYGQTPGVQSLLTPGVVALAQKWPRLRTLAGTRPRPGWWHSRPQPS